MDFPGNLTPVKRHAEDIADVLVAEVGDIAKTEVRQFDLYNAFTDYATQGQKMSPFEQDALFRTAEKRLLDARVGM